MTREQNLLFKIAVMGSGYPVQRRTQAGGGGGSNVFAGKSTNLGGARGPLVRSPGPKQNTISGTGMRDRTADAQ